MIRFGYRKVTIEDIAKQAGVGKGTVYLHWRTKDLLFEAMLLRESSNVTEEVLEVLRKDPPQVQPHRFLRLSFLASHRRPLMHALLVRDADVLGTLRDSALRDQQLLANQRFFALITRHRLLRDDVPNLVYALHAAITGFYAVDNLEPEIAELDLHAKADALAHVVRHSFEPDTEPTPEALAATVRETDALFSDLIATYRKWIYS